MATLIEEAPSDAAIVRCNWRVNEATSRGFFQNTHTFLQNVVIRFERARARGRLVRLEYGVNKLFLDQQR